jgi:outer membrane protein assembly factor BamB
MEGSNMRVSTKAGRWLRMAEAALVLLVPLASHAGESGQAGDWPVYLLNNQHNAVTDVKLPTPLVEVWTKPLAYPPQPAWPPPARRATGNSPYSQDSSAIHENACQIVVAGKSFYYPSPANHALYCADVETGQTRWRFFAEAPIRHAPTLWQGKIYFGADDGYVYCLDNSGKLMWKFSMSEDASRLPGNGHMISGGPVRSSVMIEKGQGYANAYFLPGFGSSCTFNPETGKILKKGGASKYEGYMSASAIGQTLHYFCTMYGEIPLRWSNTKDRPDYMLHVNQSAIPAQFVVFNKETGYFLSRDELFAIRFTEYPALCSQKLTLPRALNNRKAELAKLESAKDAAGIEKKKAELAGVQAQLDSLGKKLAEAALWRVKLDRPNPADPGFASFSLIMAGETLFAGREKKVAAFSIQDGKELWSAPVSGKVYGLAAAQGRLFVSTDAGVIHCFMPASAGNAGPKKDVSVAIVKAEPDAQTKARVLKMLEKVRDRKGYCLVLGGSDVGLLSALAAETEFRILALEADPQKAAAARQTLDDRGVYGRVAIHEITAEKLPYPQYFATVVVIAGATKIPPAEVARVLQPCGGVAVMADGSPVKAWMKNTLPLGSEYLGDAVLRRGPLPGAGEWTQLYGNPANTTSSGDAYVRGGVSVNWFGDPGPTHIPDRHLKPMSSLFKDGRLFIPAIDRIYALNAYNGVPLWELEVPDSRRICMPFDSGQVVLGAETVYVAAKDKCWAIDAASGKRGITLSIPPSEVAAGQEWGYLALEGETIIGTSQKPTAVYKIEESTDIAYYGNHPLVSARTIFGLDCKTGRLKWHHKKESLLFNSAIAIGGGRVYFVEARNTSAIAADKTGRVKLRDCLKKDVFLVALDLESGQKTWEHPVEFPYTDGLYLQYAGKLNTLVVSGSMGKVGPNKRPLVCYGVSTFQADTGAGKWSNEFFTPVEAGNNYGSHGEPNKHSVIMGNEFYNSYFNCDLRTGLPLPEWNPKKELWPITFGGCGSFSASLAAVFGNGAGRNMDSFEKIKYSGINRQGCYINLLPVGGVLLAPESGSGCTCFPLQTSIGYVPTGNLAPVIFPLHKTFAGTATISLEPALKDFQIRYTLDGSDPTAASPLYEKPWEITQAVTVKARLFGPGEFVSPVTTGVFKKADAQEAAK